MVGRYLVIIGYLSMLHGTGSSPHSEFEVGTFEGWSCRDRCAGHMVGLPKLISPFVPISMTMRILSDSPTERPEERPHGRSHKSCHIRQGCKYPPVDLMPDRALTLRSSWLRERRGKRQSPALESNMKW